MPTAIVLGSGHLSVRVRVELETAGLDVCHLTTEQIESTPGYQVGRLECIQQQLRDASAEDAAAIYVVDGEDRRNIEFALAAMGFNPTSPIVLSLFNEQIAPHFQINCPNLHIVNPARLAAAEFVDAISKPRAVALPERTSQSAPGEPSALKAFLTRNRLLAAVLTAFALLYSAGAIVFHETESLSWIDSFYFITTVITTTGFGDIHLRNSSDAAKVFAIATMLTSVSFLSIAFALIVDNLMERRAEMAMGRIRHRVKGHTILCGLGRVGFQVAQELLRRGNQVVIIENNEHNRFLSTIRARGVRVVHGDATLMRNLEFAGLWSAAALISVINDDLTNLEVALHARSLHPQARVILRIFDAKTAEAVKQRLNIEFAFSTSAIASKEMARLLNAAKS